MSFRRNTAQSLSLACWNIDNLHYLLNGKKYNKLDDCEIQNLLQNHDIICLVETHCSYKDIISFEGYTTVSNIRPKSKKAKKHSGGLSVLVKQYIRPGITYLPITNTEFMWFKLCKNYFNMSQDIYVAVVYKCPSNSSFENNNDDVFELLENDIATYSKLGTCILCGDFNARTNIEADSCLNDDINEFMDIPYNYVQDDEMLRGNLDKKTIDKNGDLLLNLCRSSGLRIINGRCLGDSMGYFTCFSHTGAPSVIDYMIAPQEFF